jgi:hypothetical protein
MKEQEGEDWDGLYGPTGFPAVLVPFQNLARIHDEATTSDHGSDAGNQFNIAAGADEHHNSQEDHNGQESSS